MNNAITNVLVLGLAALGAASCDDYAATGPAAGYSAPSTVSVPGCTPQEVATANSVIERAMQAAYAGNIQMVQQANLALSQSISPQCYASLQQQGAAAPTAYGGYPGVLSSPAPGQIMDAGGGTLIAPNLGACGPSGCIAF